MMISGIRSNLYASLNSLNRATKEVGKFTSQLASGEKVASVKDDGATYIRAQKMRETAKMNYVQADMLGYFSAFTEVGLQSLETAIDDFTQLRSVLVAAIDAKQNNKDTTTLQQEFNDIIARVVAYSEQGLIENMYGFGFDASGLTDIGVDYYAGQLYNENYTGTAPTTTNVNVIAGTYNVSSSIFTQNNYAPIAQVKSLYSTTNPGGKPDFTTLNFSTHVVSVISNFRTMVDENLRNMRNFAIAIGNDQRTTQNNIVKSEEIAARYEAAADNLTNADLSAVSKNLNDAQVRQQLATNVIQSALDHYRNYGTSLLNNVLSTQSSILA